MKEINEPQESFKWKLQLKKGLKNYNVRTFF
jgi:hypothetical protein